MTKRQPNPKVITLPATDSREREIKRVQAESTDLARIKYHLAASAPLVAALEPDSNVPDEQWDEKQWQAWKALRDAIERAVKCAGNIKE